MKSVTLLFTIIVLCVSAGLAQQTPSSNPTAVPHFVRFAGVIKGLEGQPPTGTVGVTFALYRDQEGGSPLWLETQNVLPDKEGHYTVSLGATTSNGLPLEMFGSGEARWLGVKMEGQPEQARVLLLSVPYALKAADAETVGGLPASAFVLATSGAANTMAPPLASASSPDLGLNIGGGGTTNFIPLWTPNGSTLGNSVFFQLGSGPTAKVGLGLTNPLATLDINGITLVRGTLETITKGVATPTKGFNSNALDQEASSYNSSAARAVMQHFEWQAEPTGNNTSSPGATLNLLFGTDNNAPAETGLKLSKTGVFTFAPGQTFPGTGTITAVNTPSGSGLMGGGTSGNLSIGLTNACAANQVLQWNGSVWVCATAGTGTITGVTAGTDLTGGGSKGNVTLSLNTTATDARYAQLVAANTFTKSQTVNGTTSGLTANASDPAGVGLFGSATANGAGTGIGVEGISISSNGVGVEGSGTTGVAGSTNVAGGYGVKGASTNGTAVWGQDSTAGYGVEGVSSSGTGVYGFSSSSNGVYGNTSHGTGVQGITGGDTINTAGVFGRAGNGTVFGGIAGVWGDADQHVGVFGSSNGFPGVAGTSQNNVGVQGVGTTGVTGCGVSGVIGTANSFIGYGVAGINNNFQGGVGVYGHSSYKATSATDSNVSQALGMGGWVKFMIFVDPFAPGGTAITRCFNSQTGSSIPPCNFSITHELQGQDLIDFGFQINDRFISTTAFNGTGMSSCVLDTNNQCYADQFFPPTATQLVTNTFSGVANVDVAFWVIVF